jgi:serine phosphatase RsbU (regulator of sigma subunit)
MSADRVFFPFAGILSGSIACQAVLVLRVHGANRHGYRLPDWLWRTDAMINLAVVIALLSILEFLSPSGPLANLSAPMFLLVPILSVQAVLRLRPGFTLLVGLMAAALHLLLAIRAIIVARPPMNMYPYYLSFSCMLGMLAFVCAFVSNELKEHVREVADEAAARELSSRQLMSIQRDLAVAREIQSGLLPTASPQLDGFDIAGMNRPADETGGDYYDWQELPDGRLAVVLADVCGHGIGPALVMAVCRAYARAMASTFNDPIAFLSTLNQLLSGDLRDGRFITFVLAVLDAEGSAQLISAGHGPTLLLRADTGDVTQFGGNGMPLAVSPAERYGPTTLIAMEEGDVLVMLTDGFFEWARSADKEQFGVARLQEALRSAAHADAETILRTLDQTVCEFCAGSPQSDDMTAIVIKRNARSMACPECAATDEQGAELNAALRFVPAVM